jgi:hypothetical protein
VASHGRLTQKKRVERALERSGKRGITQADFLGPDVIDGRAPITRLAARIGELEQDGLTIVAGGRRDGGCVIYRLAANVEPARPVEHATGWRCLACGDVPRQQTCGACPSCGAYALARGVLLAPTGQTERAAA